MAAICALVYLFIFIGWYVVSEFASDPDLALGALLTLVFGIVMGVLPAVVAGLLTGAVLGSVLGAIARPRAALGPLIGVVLAGLVVGVVNFFVLSVTGPLGPPLYAGLVGLPSLVFVVGFGCLGAWLQKQVAPTR